MATLTRQQHDTILAERERGTQVREIAKAVGLGMNTVYEVLRANGLPVKATARRLAVKVPTIRFVETKPARSAKRGPTDQVTTEPVKVAEPTDLEIKCGVPFVTRHGFEAFRNHRDVSLRFLPTLASIPVQLGVHA